MHSASPWGALSASQTAVAVSLAQDANEDFRSYMEDGQKVVDPLVHPRREGDERWGFFAVYDGHGGRDEVAYCEAKLHEVVLAELRQMRGSQDVRHVLCSAFQKVDGQLAMLGAWNSGCTATVALVHRQPGGAASTLHVANVGDSRAVLVSGGCARRVSTDHRANDPAEARRVAEEGGLVRHGRVGGQLSVSRSLGDHHLKGSGVSCVPDICTCEIGPGCALVMATDGLWDALDDEAAKEVVQGCIDRAVAQGGSPQVVAEALRHSAAKTLVERAKELGSRDNILALVAFL